MVGAHGHADIPLIHTRAQIPKTRVLAEFGMKLSLWRSTERVWLGSNPKMEQWRLPGMMDDLKDLKPPFASSQINN